MDRAHLGLLLQIESIDFLEFPLLWTVQHGWSTAHRSDGDLLVERKR